MSTKIKIPQPNPDQEEYLRNIEGSREFSNHVVGHCTCKIGGNQTTNNPPCPVHGERRFGEVRFDPDFSPEHIQNKAAAKARNWRYDEKRQQYRDVDGALVADRFGQRY